MKIRPGQMLYMTDILMTKVDVQVFPSLFMTQKINLELGDGMVGIIPVFTNKRKAQRYANKHGCKIKTFRALHYKEKGENP